MWLLCDCYVIAVWLLCGCCVVAVWLLCGCNVIAVCSQGWCAVRGGVQSGVVCTPPHPNPSHPMSSYPIPSQPSSPHLTPTRSIPSHPCTGYPPVHSDRGRCLFSALETASVSVRHSSNTPPRQPNVLQECAVWNSAVRDVKTRHMIAWYCMLVGVGLVGVGLVGVGLVGWARPRNSAPGRPGRVTYLKRFFPSCLNMLWYR